MTTPPPASGDPSDPYRPIDYPAGYSEPPAYYPPPGSAPTGYPDPSYPPPGYPPATPGYPPTSSNYPSYPPPASAYPPPLDSYAPPAGYPTSAGYPLGPYQRPGNNGLSIASLVTSILGLVFGIPLTVLCWIGFVVPVVGVVLGVISLNQIKTSGQSGRGMAIAGIIIGAVAVLVIIVAVVIFVAALATSTSSYG